MPSLVKRPTLNGKVLENIGLRYTRAVGRFLDLVWHDFSVTNRYKGYPVHFAAVENAFLDIVGMRFYMGKHILGGR